MVPIDSHISSSCTIFTASIGDTVLFGNNEDYKDNNAYRWYIPAQNVSTLYNGKKEIYGGVLVATEKIDIQFETIPDTAETSGMIMPFSLLAICMSILVYIELRKKRRN